MTSEENDNTCHHIYFVQLHALPEGCNRSARRFLIPSGTNGIYCLHPNVHCLGDNLKKLEKSLESLKTGDVVCISWTDTFGMDRMTWEEIGDLEEPPNTRCWGVVVKKTAKYLIIATEICDSCSDGNYIEMLPFGMIRGCKVLDHLDLEKVRGDSESEIE